MTFKRYSKSQEERNNSIWGIGFLQWSYLVVTLIVVFPGLLLSVKNALITGLYRRVM